jgi:AraC family transcriptional regulator, arabinose operon regulatory protein
MAFTTYRRHSVITELDQQLPLHLESVGLSGHQEDTFREKGYPYYHWLHTVEGSGEFIVNNELIKLTKFHGILLKPNTPHSYNSSASPWVTWYITFGGVLALSILTSMGFPVMTPIHWNEDSPLENIHQLFEQKSLYNFDLVGIKGSMEVYSFITLLKMYGHVSGQSSLSKDHEKLKPILIRIEKEFNNTEIGLPWMAEILHISPQYVNTLFRKVFGISAYQYLLQFRIMKSKEFLLNDRSQSIKQISLAVGFKDPSHFVSYFRKITGISPERFRVRHIQS